MIEECYNHDEFISLITDEDLYVWKCKFFIKDYVIAQDFGTFIGSRSLYRIRDTDFVFDDWKGRWFDTSIDKECTNDLLFEEIFNKLIDDEIVPNEIKEGIIFGLNILNQNRIYMLDDLGWVHGQKEQTDKIFGR